MKRIYSVMAIMLLMVTAFSQVPGKMSYQAVIRNSNDQLLTEQQVGMRISILQGSGTGTPVYVETQSPSTNANGLVTIEIGGGLVQAGSFGTINWADGNFYLKTDIDLSGGTNYTITGTSQLLTVPYALYAQKAGNGFSGSYADLTGKPANMVTLTNAPAAGDLLYFNGTNWVALPKGENGKLLSIQDGVPVWQSQQSTFLLPPTVTTQSATNIQVDGAVLNATINANGLTSDYKFEWGLNLNYGNSLYDPGNIITGNGNTSVSAELSMNNIAGKTIHYRIISSNPVGTSTGNDITFTIPTGVPKLSGFDSYNFIGTSLSCYGSIASDGGSMLLAKGICWSTSQNPTITDNHTTDDMSDLSDLQNIYTIYGSLTGLTPNTTYYIRTYATSASGTGYSEQYSFNSGYAYGTVVGGGLVFYNDGKGHGLVCAASDQSIGAPWGCYGTEIPGLGTESGNYNTPIIVSGCSEDGIAAKICYNLSLNGYDDWFLPSFPELSLMKNNLKSIGLGSFSNNRYWTSNQHYGPGLSTNPFTSIVLDMNGMGSPTAISKSTSCYVRAVRAF